MKKNIATILLSTALIVSSFSLFSCNNTGNVDETTASDTVSEVTTAEVTTTAEATAIEITTLPTKIEYAVGEKFDPAGMVVSFVYADGSKVATTDYTIDNSAGLGENDIFVTVKSGNLTVDVPIAIIVEYLSEGSGTKEDPYIIASGGDFEKFHEELRSGTVYDGEYFKQTADIDTAGLDIGVSSDCTFGGIYDGCGHKINVNIESEDAYNNIFPTVIGVVANLGTTGTIAAADSCHAAGIARTISDTGIIFNVWSTVSVTTGTHSAGIVYHNYGGTISCALSAGKLNGSSRQYPISTLYYGGGSTYEFIYATDDVQTRFDEADYEHAEKITRDNMSVAVDAINENVEAEAERLGINEEISIYKWTVDQIPKEPG